MPSSFLPFPSVRSLQMALWGTKKWISRLFFVKMDSLNKNWVTQRSIWLHHDPLDLSPLPCEWHKVTLNFLYHIYFKSLFFILHFIKIFSHLFSKATSVHFGSKVPSNPDRFPGNFSSWSILRYLYGGHLVQCNYYRPLRKVWAKPHWRTIF